MCRLGDDHNTALYIPAQHNLTDCFAVSSGNGCEICADVNGDGNVNISDVTTLIDKLLGGAN